MRRRPIGALVVMTAVAVVLVLSRALPPPLLRLVADLTGLINSVAATAAFARTARACRGAERCWRVFMSVGMAGWAVGQVVWTWHRSVDNTVMTFPNLENTLYLAAPVGVFAALVVIARADRATARDYDTAAPTRVLVLDGLVIVTSMVGLAWDVLSAGQPGRVGFGKTLLTVSYTIGDLVLIVLVILMAVTLHSMWRPRLSWLMAGLVAIGVSDVIYAYAITTGRGIPGGGDLGYMTGPLLLLPAAFAPARRRSTRRRSAPPVLLGLPHVPLAALCAVVVLDAGAGRVQAVEIYVLTAVVALVVTRHLVTMQQLYRAHRWLSHHALHDPLTGAANRALLTDVLDDTATGAQHARGAGLVYVDIDRFKDINDTLGHRAGDVLLRTTVDRLRRCVRAGDTVARVGGDEFVLLVNPAPADPDDLLRRIATTLEAPIPLDDRSTPVTITASLGYHPIARDQDPHDALANADRAMYRHKRGPR